MLARGDASVNMDALAVFTAALLAATWIPASSEAVLAGALVAGGAAPWLVACATLGNTLGGLVSYGLGRFARHALGGREHARAARLWTRWGGASLLLAWMPLVGDALCTFAGWQRYGAARFVALTALGRGLRYGLVALAVQT